MRKRYMKTKRPISINNSLVHGICNCNCSTCGVNKKSFTGPKEYQGLEITKHLVQRIIEAARQGIYIRYAANAGDGEPTLHPQFEEHIALFGGMLQNWNIRGTPAPEVSVVTNGLHLDKKNILSSIIQNNISLIISIPTLDPGHYGEILFMDPQKGEKAVNKLKHNLEKVFEAAGNHSLYKCRIHLSPPVGKYIRGDFAQTIRQLTEIARKYTVSELLLTTFPVVSNRTGLVKKETKGVDSFKDLYRKFNNRVVNGVVIKMESVLKRFFNSPGEILDHLLAFDYPCLWFANFFIGPDGKSYCCNDQALKEPLGSIVEHSIGDLMKKKECCEGLPICKGCNQAPDRMEGTFFHGLYRTLARLRMK